MKRLFLSITIMLLFFLTACGLHPAETPTPTTTYLTPVKTEPLTPTETLVPTRALVLPTPTPYVPVKARIIYEDFRLRTGPGYQFETVELYPMDALVAVLGTAPGQNWMYVQSPDNLTGWMKVDGLELPLSIYDIPYCEPENVLTVHGHVYTTNGNPASSMTVMINPEGAVDTKFQDVAITDVLGRWYLYLPRDYEGNWTIVTNGYGCDSSAANAICSMLGNYPPAQMITLPQSPDTWLDFQLVPYGN